MIVADTSAWVEFLRGTEHAAGRALRRLIERDADVVVTEIVVMELLAGVSRGRRLQYLRSRLMAFPMLRLEGLADFERAALVYRMCRDAGETLSSMTDCLIAVPAMRARASVLHNDRDFDAIARHGGLRIYRAG